MNTVTLPARAPLMAVCVVLAALAAIVGSLETSHGPAWQWLHWIAKPLATFLLVLMAAGTTPALSARYRCWIVAALGFSLLGDVLLMLPRDLFVPGLAAFLLAHLCYLIALTADARFAARPLAWLACLGFGGLNLVLLWPALAPGLRPAVIAYMLVLTTMGGQALGRAWQHHALGDALARPASKAAVGAVLFVLSDTLLAWDRFHAPLPLAPLWILATYYVAQYLLARSVQRLAPGEAST